MSIYTETDFQNIKDAYLALATGARTVSVSWGDKSQTFQQTDMATLRNLMAEISNDLAAAGSSDGSFRIRQQSKGL